jgi:hypothetical protein
MWKAVVRAAVPLPFIAATSSYDEQHADTAMAHEYEDRWVRPYRPGPYRVAGAALLLMLASYLLFAALIFALSGGLPGAGLALGTAVLVIGIALRLVRIGVWVSQEGVRQVALLQTVTLAWEEVASLRTSQQPVKWLGLPRTVQGQAVLVTRTDGQVLRPLLTDHNADFLGRGEAFDMAADAVESWASPR